MTTGRCRPSRQDGEVRLYTRHDARHGPVPHSAWGRGGVMEVTEVRVFPVHEERLKAYVAITFDHCFVVRDLKVIDGNNGLFVAMPSKKRKDGTYRDTAHPLNSQTRQMIESVVLAEYDKEIRKAGDPISNAKI